MSTRYATIIPGDDGGEIVSNIAQVEGSAPDVNFGKVEKVADGVLIGMVRGGPVSPVGGFGFPEGTASTATRGVGVAKAEPKDKPVRAKAKDKPAADDAAEHDALAGEQAAAGADAKTTE